MPTIVGSIIAIIGIVALLSGCVYILRTSGGCSECGGNCSGGSCGTHTHKKGQKS